MFQTVSNIVLLLLMLQVATPVRAQLSTFVRYGYSNYTYDNIYVDIPQGWLIHSNYDEFLYVYGPSLDKAICNTSLHPICTTTMWIEVDRLNTKTDARRLVSDRTLGQRVYWDFQTKATFVSPDRLTALTILRNNHAHSKHGRRLYSVTGVQLSPSQGITKTVVLYDITPESFTRFGGADSVLHILESIQLDPH
ncbi:MAG: hypothetical protein AAF708_18300 [Deinococcota bacterium]